MEKATLGGGCFWCIEAVFEQLNGVESVVSGYAGGSVPNPTYQQVCMEDTGHAEVVQITFDTAVIPFETLLDVFFLVHDPTSLNRQDNDVGTQYRSVILYHSEEQKRVAEQKIHEHQQHYSQPIVTELSPMEAFYPAEDYHQDYYQQHGQNAYCQLIITPKLQKLLDHYSDKMRSSL